MLKRKKSTFQFISSTMYKLIWIIQEICIFHEIHFLYIFETISLKDESYHVIGYYIKLALNNANRTLNVSSIKTVDSVFLLLTECELIPLE